MGRPTEQSASSRPGDAAVGAALTGAAIALSAVTPAARRAVATRLPGPVAETLTSLGLTAVGWSLVAVTEWRRPFRAAWRPDREEARVELGYILLATPLTGLAARAVSQVVMPRTRGAASRPAPGPVAAVGHAVAGLAITELVHYWHHRLSHEWPSLWRFHVVHHSPDRLNWLNSLRFHPVDMFPLLVLQLLGVRGAGIDEDAQARVEVLKGIHGQLQHSNISVQAGPLRWVFSTPEQHREHHASGPRTGRTNYGAVLSVFDELFGTSSRPSAEPFVGRIGPGPGGSVPTTFGGQILAPLGGPPGRLRRFARPPGRWYARR